MIKCTVSLCSGGHSSIHNHSWESSHLSCVDTSMNVTSPWILFPPTASSLVQCFLASFVCSLSGLGAVIFFQFCAVAQVVIIISIFGEIWSYSKYENRKCEAPFHIVGNCDDLWWFFFKKLVNIYFLKQGICNRILFFQNIFLKWNCYQKNHC
jgi:hypothetical protein